MKKTVCIYKITNTVTGDFYIGQTRDLERRIRGHKNNPPSNMKEDVKEYGWDAFKFEILEECFVEDLARLEENFIKTLKPSYNIRYSQQNMTDEICSKISESRKGIKFLPEHRQKIQKRMSEQAVELFGKAVICLETQEVFESMVEASEKLGIKPQNISAALHGRQKTAGGYTWKYADESLNITENVQLQSVNRKRILCVETGEIFHSIVEAANKNGTTFKGISNVLHGRAITAGGFHWKYADENLNYAIRDENDRHDKRKPVLCVETGEVFQSMADAAKHFGIFASGIYEVLNGIKVTTGGYHWKYADGRPDKTREKKQQKLYTKSIVCVETGKIFPSIKSAANKIGVHRTSISNALKNPSR